MRTTKFSDLPHTEILLYIITKTLFYLNLYFVCQHLLINSGIHDPGVAEYCGRTVVMKDGKIV